MKFTIALTALASAALAPAAAQAQALPAAVIAVVDLSRVTSECNACKTATAALKSQDTAIGARQKALGEPLEAEARSIQASIDALKGAPADAALQARIKAFQTKQQSAAAEIQKKQQDLQRLQAHIQQQVQTKLEPIYNQVLTRRGANLLLEVNSTLATAAAIDITADVTSALNASMPSISTTLPAQPAQPSGR